jgi:hypothetical protein
MEKSNVDSFINISNNKIKFLTVEDKPLLETPEAIMLAVLGLVILTVGVVVQSRIWTKLSKTSEKSSAINSLFLSHTAVTLIFCPPLIIYFILNFFLFPMSDYIGFYGCLFVVHFLDVFNRMVTVFFPLVVVLLRYLFIVKHLWVKSVGITR